ncbi:LOW QUALITY PROTEIN: catechol O-methyltransferase domain-containing protein 1 [Bombina bombina]|uniref:LOW QUALITY PROTEIN: catechol O-methyltransferase domain-containing protein 1 n=1 Tax=Bombina bombina TaxID=8345 RepID=UPI00235A7AB6|nr:LOW QUALITY PROTEIN: catechol O-methyltransferase domain-containing protein 1 [Bombina bombina]
MWRRVTIKHDLPVMLECSDKFPLAVCHVAGRDCEAGRKPGTAAVLCTCSGCNMMSLSTVKREAAVGIALLGVTFAAGVYIGKHYFLFRRKKSQKIFEGVTDPRRDYLLRFSLREHPAAKRLRLSLPGAAVQDVSSDAAQLLGNLAKVIKARKALEMGGSCGYNPLVLALVLPSDGKVTVSLCDGEDITNARECWREAGVDHKIIVSDKPAEQIADDLLSAGEDGTFDLVSVNMTHQQDYKKCYEKCLRLVRSGGILAIDGVLCGGTVLKLERAAVTEIGMHQLNEAILRDARVSLSILPLGDGLSLCFKL